MFRTRKETRRSRQRRSRDLPLWLKVSLIVLLGAAAVALAYLAVIDVGSNDHSGIPVRPEALTVEQTLTSKSVSPTGGEIGVDTK